MQSNLNLSLLEILAYLAPGLIVETIFVYTFFDLTKIPSSAMGITVLVLGGYVIGHALTIISLPLVKFRGVVKKIRKEKTREEKYSFYLYLRAHLRYSFGANLTRSDEYFYALRLAIEHCPQSASTIDRLTALALFSRNVCASFLLCIPILMSKNFLFGAISSILGILFFQRYRQFERALEGTVFRVAYIYFVEHIGQIAD